MTTIDQLLAKDEIRDLALRYALGVDGKDVDAVAALFAPDVDNGRYGRGREGVIRFYDQSLRKFHCSMHLVANHVIDLVGPDRATGVVYCSARHHVVEPEHWFDEALAYWDTYERISGRWCFRRRQVRSWYRQHVEHPDIRNARVEAAVEVSGPKRGGRMPEAFATFEAFWARAPLAERP
jgi:SnoaL-like domain